MTSQLIQQLPSDSVKTGRMWCALSLSKQGSAVLRLSYLGTESVITAHQASAFTARNPRNPEADPKAALD